MQKNNRGLRNLGGGISFLTALVEHIGFGNHHDSTNWIVIGIAIAY